MTVCKIHQIYYSPESFAALDPGFIPLDNTHGRQDWMEYWPIRQYFLNTPVGDDELVGFFSPRFFEKTGLTATDVHEHIQANPGHDVYLFNPYFHLAAWHPNLFIQGEASHPGLIKALENILKKINIDLKIDELIMSSINTVYCNYFVANVKFWKEWLTLCEFIFQISEIKDSRNSIELNRKTKYVRGDMSMQIFIIERIASLLLSISNEWRISPKYIYKSITYQTKKELPFLEKMKVLDALKTSFIISNNSLFLNSYNLERQTLRKDYALYV
jgi:hypothetical protein